MSPGRSKEPVHFQNVYEGFVISGICLVKVVSIVPSSGITTFCATAYSVECTIHIWRLLPHSC